MLRRHDTDRAAPELRGRQRLGMAAQVPILASDAAAETGEEARVRPPHDHPAQEADTPSQTPRVPASRGMREAIQTSPGAQLDARPGAA